MNTTTKKAANSIVGKLTAGILAAAAVAAAPASASVLVVGDSLEVGSGPYLRATLPGTTLSIDAVVGRTSSEGVRVLAARLDPSVDVIVFPLGTNDSPSSPGTLAADLDAAARLAGDRCMVVATIVRPPVRGTSVAGLNRVVESFAARTGAQVADWRAAVGAFPSLLGRDGVHAVGDGYALRASLIAEAVDGCTLGGGAGGAAGVAGIPAPRNPDARPPGRDRARAAPALLPAAAALDALVFIAGRAVSPVAGALHAARTAATKSGPEPVLGAP
jgi:lysophospholipase L1-like esterase